MRRRELANGTDKQGPDVRHKELYPITCDKLQWKKMCKRIHTHTHTHTHTQNGITVLQKSVRHCKSTILPSNRFFKNGDKLESKANMYKQFLGTQSHDF